jgi:hypothetical protein
LEFQQELGTTNEVARDKAMQAKLDELVGRIGDVFQPPRNVLTAEVVSQPIAKIHQDLQIALRKSLRQFAHEFEGALQSLVDQQLGGLVEWIGTDACRYHFFKETIIQENDGFTRIDLTEDATTNRRGVQSRTVREGEVGRHIHRWSRHEHHVMNAFHTAIRNSKVIMPPKVQRLVNSIPEWLYDLVQIIDGEIIRERVVERDYRNDLWEDTKTRDVPIYGCEPAVIIDQYVLTGWGPREVATEQNRLASLGQANQQQAFRGEKFAWLAACVLASIGAALMYAMATRDPSGSLVWSGVLVFASFYAATQVARAHGQSIGCEARIYHYFCAVFIVAGFVSAAALLLGARRPADVVVGIALLALAILGTKQVKRLWPIPQTTQPHRKETES